MKRERDDDREGGVVVEKICRGDGPRGRGRARGGRGSTRRYSTCVKGFTLVWLRGDRFLHLG